MKIHKKFLVAALTVTLLGSLAFVGTAYAVDPGCYEQNAEGTYDVLPISSCPGEGYARAVSEYGACFVGTEERNCDDLDVDGSLVPSGGQTIDDVETISFTVDCEPPEGISLDRTNCGIINLIVIGINFLTAVAGIVFVLSIMISGFQYMTAQDNAAQIQKAKSRITMTLLALAIYIFMYALLNFLVPGGVL